MPRFLIKVEAECEIEADNEDEAMEKFWMEEINDTQMDAATYIEENLTINEIT